MKQQAMLRLNDALRLPVCPFRQSRAMRCIGSRGVTPEWGYAEQPQIEPIATSKSQVCSLNLEHPDRDFIHRTQHIYYAARKPFMTMRLLMPRRPGGRCRILSKRTPATSGRINNAAARGEAAMHRGTTKDCCRSLA